MIYQCMFAIITPALITGAIAERMKFKTYLVFMLLWSTLVYDVVAHWVWGTGGWLRSMGALDFAGGTVVHISSGVSALIAAVMVGRRRGYPHTVVPPHNLPYTLLGAGLLWFGWFGFNAGSALGINGVAVNALVTTNIAAAFASLSWMMVDWVLWGKPSATGAATGAVCGLVAITPAAGFVDSMAAIIMGLLVGFICNMMVVLLDRTGLDDTLDVFACHGMGGIFGAVVTGVFAQKMINPAGADGLLYGNPKQVLIQLAAVAATAIWGFVMSVVLLKVIDWTMGLRVTPEEEEVGLDLSQHGEVAYSID
jgi:Amt family ammonium transporter